MVEKEEILNFLKKKNNWAIVGEIACHLNKNRSVVKTELTNLFKKGLIEREKNLVIKGSGYIWKYKNQK